jgi:23S rRNA pseudouridine1911/1915/1917 synthase
MDKSFIITMQNMGRIDKFLAKSLNQSRNQIEQLIKKGFVSINGDVVSKTSIKLKLDDVVDIVLPQPIEDNSVCNYNIDFDIDIVYEDNDIMVINKPSGVVVHSAPSVKEATLVDWLKSQNISLSTISAEIRHGIVHRLDKGTSGLMVIAKSNEAHICLSSQLSDKSMGRYYLAFIDMPLKEDIIIDKPIGRNRKNRLKMDIISTGKNAKSSFRKIATSDNGKYEMISAKLFTGRTHQIRVHLNSINRHILGDHLYGFKGDLDMFARVYLHAYKLYLMHPITQKYMEFKIPLPQDMQQFLDKYF